MAASQGKALAKATSASGTMYLHDLKALLQVFDESSRGLVATDEAATERCFEEYEAMRSSLVQKLVHPLQARSQAERKSVEELLRACASLVASLKH